MCVHARVSRHAAVCARAECRNMISCTEPSVGKGASERRDGLPKGKTNGAAAPGGHCRFKFASGPVRII